MDEAERFPAPRQSPAGTDGVSVPFTYIPEFRRNRMEERHEEIERQFL